MPLDPAVECQQPEGQNSQIKHYRLSLYEQVNEDYTNENKVWFIPALHSTHSSFEANRNS